MKFHKLELPLPSISPLTALTRYFFFVSCSGRITNLKLRSALKLIFALQLLATAPLATSMEDHIDIFAGQKLEVLLIKENPDSPPINQVPFREILAPAFLKYGIEEFYLPVERVVRGDFSPEQIVISLSQTSDKLAKVNEDVADDLAAFQTEYGGVNGSSEPPYIDVKRVDLIAEEGASINLNNSKLQTISFIWLNSERIEDYVQYELGMQSIQERLGVVSMARIETANAGYYSMTDSELGAPDYVIFTEWPDSSSITRYFESDEFKEFGAYLDSAIRDISILQLDNESVFSTTKEGYRLTPDK